MTRFWNWSLKHRATFPMIVIFVLPMSASTPGTSPYQEGKLCEIVTFLPYLALSPSSTALRWPLLSSSTLLFCLSQRALTFLIFSCHLAPAFSLPSQPPLLKTYNCWYSLGFILHSFLFLARCSPSGIPFITLVLSTIYALFRWFSNFKENIQVYSFNIYWDYARQKHASVSLFWQP